MHLASREEAEYLSRCTLSWDSRGPASRTTRKAVDISLNSLLSCAFVERYMSSMTVVLPASRNDAACPANNAESWTQGQQSPGLEEQHAFGLSGAKARGFLPPLLAHVAFCPRNFHGRGALTSNSSQPRLPLHLLLSEPQFCQPQHLLPSLSQASLPSLTLTLPAQSPDSPAAPESAADSCSPCSGGPGEGPQRSGSESKEPGPVPRKDREVVEHGAVRIHTQRGLLKPLPKSSIPPTHTFLLHSSLLCFRMSSKTALS